MMWYLPVVLVCISLMANIDHLSFFNLKFLYYLLLLLHCRACGILAINIYHIRK